MLVRIRTRLGRLKREAFFTPPLNHIVVEPLLAALCDLFIAARVVTVEMCVSGGTCNRWSHHVPSRPIGTHLTTANHHCFLCTLSPYPPVVCTHPLHSQCLSRRPQGARLPLLYNTTLAHRSEKVTPERVFKNNPHF